MSTRIAVLDAEPTVRSVVVKTLCRAGYDVEPADTLEAAIEIIKDRPPDLLLTNVYLPGVTGHEAMRLLKAIRPDLPVLMVSGLPDSEVIRDWAGRDGFDTFPKPFTPDELVDKVRKMLDGANDEQSS
jgi:DNA-binding response OmpR family regulator